MKIQTQFNMTTVKLIARVTFRAHSAQQASKMRRGEVESEVASEAIKPFPDLPRLAQRLIHFPDVVRVQLQATDTIYSIILEQDDLPHA